MEVKQGRMLVAMIYKVLDDFSHSSSSFIRMSSYIDEEGWIMVEELYISHLSFI